MKPFDLVLKDFANWKMDNVDVLERLRNEDSPIYDRLEPVYLVLNHIYREAVDNGGSLDEEMENIFQVGFDYLSNQFDVVRIYYEKLFKSDCAAFSEFSTLVGYLLFISDLRADLEEYEAEAELDFTELNDVETMIETMIAQRDTRFEYAAERLNRAVDELIEPLGFEYVSIVDIFVEIAGTLGIALDRGESLVIGEDI